MNLQRPDETSVITISNTSACLGPLVRCLTLAGCLLLSGCASWIQGSTTAAASRILSGFTTSLETQSDTQLVEQGLPTLLLLLDGLVASQPDDPELRRQASQAYSTYCRAFVEDEKRQLLLYERARSHGLALLEQLGFEDPVYSPFEQFEAELANLDSARDAYIVGSAWLGWILADPESMDAVADGPRALALLEHGFELDPNYGNGAMHLVFAIYKASKPRGAGQDLQGSRMHFDRAADLAGPDALLPRVLRAEFLGKATLDRDYFESELEQVLARERTPGSANALSNSLARERASKLLAQIDRIF